MTNSVLHPDEIEGWRGVIEDGEVVQDHEEALAEQEHGADELEDHADGELVDEEDPDDRQEDLDEDGIEDNYEDVGDEDEGTGPEDEADAEQEYEEGVEGARAPERGRRSSGRLPRSGRPRGGEERPQRMIRRRAGTRGGT